MRIIAEPAGRGYDVGGGDMSLAPAEIRDAMRKQVAAFGAKARATPVASDKVTERQLAAIWRGRRFPAGALVTRQGVPVTVIYQGRDGRGAGPDFRGAVIAGPSGLPVRGDVELHVLLSSFRAHGHERDAAYAGVVLHVVFEDDTGVDTPLPGGRIAPVVALAPWVAARAGELERWLAQPLLWREPCHDAVMRMGVERAGAALDAEGDRRFEEKAELMAARIGEGGIEQALYEGLLEAMGYGGNAPAMLALARTLPWRFLSGFLSGGRTTSWHVDMGHAEAIRRGRGIGGEPPANPTGIEVAGQPAAWRIEAVLLGGAGLLPSQRGHRGPLDPYVEGLEREFARRQKVPSQRGRRGPLDSCVAALETQFARRDKMRPQLDQRGTREPDVEGVERELTPRQTTLWKLSGIRPENAPARRIAGAAAMLRSLGSPSRALAIVRARNISEVTGPLSAFASGYWRTHHDLCAGPCRLPPAFIGRSRALEIAVNVVLPAAAVRNDPEMAAQARALYKKLPRPASYGRTRFIENALASSGIRVSVNARRAQGLLALNRDWCTQNGCGRCSLSAGLDASVERTDAASTLVDGGDLRPTHG